jgi:hypothetical protein
MNEQLMDAIVVRESGKIGDWNTLVMDKVSRPMLKAGQVLVRRGCRIVQKGPISLLNLVEARSLFSAGLYPWGYSDLCLTCTLARDFLRMAGEPPSGLRCAG